MNRVIRSFSIVLVFSLLLGVLCSFDIYEAADVKDYPSENLSCSLSISNNGGAYIDTDTPSHSSHSLRLTIIFDKPLSGKSTLNLSFFLAVKGYLGNTFKVDGIHFYDVKGNRVLSPSSSIVKLNKTSTDTCYPTINDFSFGLDRDISINRIQLYFITNDSSISSSYNYRDFVVSYSVAELMEDVVIPSPEDQENVNNSNSSMNDNKEQMDSMLDDMASVPDPDADDLVANLDKYLPTEHIAAFSSVMGSLFQNEIVIVYVMIGLVVSLVSFVLFGKKG